MKMWTGALGCNGSALYQCDCPCMTCTCSLPSPGLPAAVAGLQREFLQVFALDGTVTLQKHMQTYLGA